MFLLQLPEVDVSGVRTLARVGYIENVPECGTFAPCVDECNAFGAALYVSAHRIVPDIILGTGDGIRSLGMDHDLFMIGVLVQSRGGGQKRLPALKAAGDLPLRIR